MSVARALALTLVVMLAGCGDVRSGGPILSEQSAGSVARGRGQLPNLFVSPFGEPFRAPPDAPYAVAVWFAGADANHDGHLTLDEFRRDGERFFRSLDTNHDGVVDGFEIAAYEKAIAPEILPRIEGLRAREGWTGGLDRGGPVDPGRRESGGGVTQGAGLFSLLNEPEPVAAADADLDGRVTLPEMDAAAARRFEAIDTLKSGSLTLSTLPKTPVQSEIEKRRPNQHPH